MQSKNKYLSTSPTEEKNFDTAELRNRFIIGTISALIILQPIIPLTTDTL